MRRTLVILALLMAPTRAAAAPLLAVAERGEVAVRAGAREIAAIDLSSLQPVWSAPGVRDPHLLILSPDGRWAAAIDSISNRLAVADLAHRTSRLQPLPETPLAAAFLDGALFVVSRDARLLSRIDPAGGETRTAELPPGTSRLSAVPAGVVVYSPLTGTAVRFDPETLESLATAELPRFGSDLEVDGGKGYLVVPRSGQLAVFDVDTLALDHRRAAGAVPTDVALVAPATAVRAARIAIADPSSKRVWREEGAQSTAQAFGRGFLRGLLGLGLYTPRSAAFPTGVDRLVISGGRLLAFDSSTGTVFAAGGDPAKSMASGLAWGAFAVAGEELLIAREEGIERHPLP